MWFGGESAQQDHGFYEAQQREKCVFVDHHTESANISIVEFATVGKTPDGKVYHHLWGADEITTLLKEHGLAKAEEADTG